MMAVTAPAYVEIGNIIFVVTSAAVAQVITCTADDRHQEHGSRRRTLTAGERATGETAL